MKNGLVTFSWIALGITFAVASGIAASLWQTAPSPGEVEAQIRSFGPVMEKKLATEAKFVRSEQKIGGVKVRGFETPYAKVAGAELSPFFPELYSAGNQVTGKGMTVTLKPLGSNASKARIEHGKLVYHQAYFATDSLQVVNGGETEEFLLLHSARAPHRFEYEIADASGVTNIQLQGNTVRFNNAQGKAISLSSPWLIEAGNKYTSEAVRWELTPSANGKAWPRIALVVDDPKKLRYPVVIDPSWSPANGDLVQERDSHTSTLLNDGRLIIAGGDSGGDDLDSVEFYDSATGFSQEIAGVKLNHARSSHTATLLRNGKILVAGGFNAVVNPVESELFDPSTNKWTISGSLHQDRYFHTATLLNNGQVLVVGGYANSGQTLKSAELYDPATGKWTDTGSLTTGRTFHTATLLPNGKVLVTGGYYRVNDTELSSTEIYDPATGKWTTTGKLKVSRSKHSTTLLADGRVLITGGYNLTQGYLSSSELYNPVTGLWTQTGSLNTARKQNSATLLPNGKVFIAAGYNKNAQGGDVYLNSTELYDPASGQWTQQADLATARIFHTTSLLPNGILVVIGGMNLTGDLASLELYDPHQGAFLAANPLRSARSHHTATLLPNGKVLVAGGFDGGLSLASAELYNPANGVWSATGNLHGARGDHTATLLGNGKVLVAGGLDESTGKDQAAAELYDPATGKWTVTGSLQLARDTHTATLLTNGLVLVSGGQNSAHQTTGSNELYDPISGTWLATGGLHRTRYLHTATLLPNGQVLLAGGYSTTTKADLASAELYNPATGLCANTGNLGQARTAHSAALLENGAVLFAGGKTSAGVTLASAELYDLATGTFSPTGSLLQGRSSQAMVTTFSPIVVGGISNSSLAAETYDPASGEWTASTPTEPGIDSRTATLLTSGQILLAGGHLATAAAGVSVATSQRIDSGLGFTPANQPVVKKFGNIQVVAGAILKLTGTGFDGISEGTSGEFGPSASNIPVARLQSLANGQILEPGLNLAKGAKGFTDTTLESAPVYGLPAGPMLLSVVVNGISSEAQVLNFNLPTQTITFPAIPDKTLASPPFTLAATASSGLPVSYLATGPAKVVGNKVTLTGTGTVSIKACQAGYPTYTPALPVTRTFTVN